MKQSVKFKPVVVLIDLHYPKILKGASLKPIVKEKTLFKARGIEIGTSETIMPSAPPWVNEQSLKEKFTFSADGFPQWLVYRNRTIREGIESTLKLIRAARKLRIPIIVFKPSSSGPIRHILLKQISDQVSDSDTILEKSEDSILSNARLEKSLKKFGANVLIIGGGERAVCALKSIKDAHSRGFKILTSEDIIYSNPVADMIYGDSDLAGWINAFDSKFMDQGFTTNEIQTLRIHMHNMIWLEKRLGMVEFDTSYDQFCYDDFRDWATSMRRQLEFIAKRCGLLVNSIANSDTIIGYPSVTELYATLTTFHPNVDRLLNDIRNRITRH
ncbi:cysteine hydrolase [Candidatus Micrarchaeota archaeon]|nr:cysteine hydrolase [Candidatus Micrarchaeota archaeon]